MIKLCSWSFSSKSAKFYVDLKNVIKILEKVFGFEEDYVWTCVANFSQFLRENMW